MHRPDVGPAGAATAFIDLQEDFINKHEMNDENGAPKKKNSVEMRDNKNLDASFLYPKRQFPAVDIGKLY